MARSAGQKFERKFLKKVKARPQPNSGAIPGFPNDGRKGDWLIECKSTIHASLGIKGKWLDDLKDAATLRGLRPVLAFVLGDSPDEWMVITKRDFEALGLWDRRA